MDANAPYHVMGEIVEALGSREFGAVLVDGLRRLVPFSHATVFTFPRHGSVEYLLTEGRIDSDVAVSLAENYVRQYYRLDPNLAMISGCADSGPRFVRHDPARITSRRYRDLFFRTSRLADKYSVIFSRRGVTYYCNFYRSNDDGTFRSDEIAGLETLTPLVVSSLCKHYSALFPDTAPDGAQAAPADAAGGLRAVLTEREAAVCDRIVMGFSSEAIALDLGIAENTVKTYRKRAYRKLGIGSQNELFALALRDGTPVTRRRD